MNEVVSGSDVIDYDPLNPALDVAPYDVWRRMRDEAPAYYHDRLGFWALSRYDDVSTALTDTTTFSSAYGNVLELMSDEPVTSGMMILNDPPGHTRLRKLVSRAFTMRRIAELEDTIRAICESLIVGWRAGEDFEFVRDFAAQIPSRVIAELMGVPEDDRERVRRTIDAVFHLDPEKGMFNDVSGAAIGDLDTYVTDLLRRRATAPEDDLISGLAETDLSERETVEFVLLLVAAGTETVGRLLGWAAVLLDQHPEQRAALAADPSLVPAAVEELLRFEGPSPVQARRSTRAVDLHGVTIPSGATVLLLTSSAGRDERQYGEDAASFDIHRESRHHVSLGYGAHFCLGASLARLESRVALETLMRTHPTWTVDLARSERAHTSTVRGWERIVVR